MKLVVGLGNPGKKYAKTRHNAGFLLADLLVEKLKEIATPLQETWKESKKGKLVYNWLEDGGKKIEVIKPQSFMNESGSVFRYILEKHPELKLENTFVAYDDLDIKLGEYKIQKGKGPKDHNGLLDIYEKTAKRDFWHIRIGIDNRSKNNEKVTGSVERVSGEDYVLMAFKDDELGELEQVLGKIVQELNDSYLR